jgi:hypothetical protein
MIYDFKGQKRQLLISNVKSMAGEYIGTGQRTGHFAVDNSHLYRAKS